MMFITSFTSPVFSSNPFFLVFVRDTAKEKNYTLTSCLLLFISWVTVLMSENKVCLRKVLDIWV